MIVKEKEENTKERLLEVLTDFKKRTGVWNSLLVTEDGLVIASDDISQIMGNLETMGYYQNIGAVSAGALSMAEQSIKLIDANKELKQLIIHAGSADSLYIESFSIILTLIHSNIILLVIYPSILNVGMILYEIENVGKEIHQYMSDGEHILHEESVL
ncbi:MAG: roadblock/LC7 domain-containing protein [Candidatus Heimdallarchaeota archaeon]|nr:roadblock/LC7 domain-containing protein [Candidatus Heimdallarchaeota archaeon]